MDYTLKQLEEATEKNHSTRQDFIKHILTIASGMLAILAAFHTSGVNTDYLNILYLSTLALLSIGIVTGGITLYYDTVAAKSIYLKLKEAIIKQLKNPSESTSPVIYNPPGIFFVCEKICYIALLLAVVLLACYSALR